MNSEQFENFLINELKKNGILVSKEEIKEIVNPEFDNFLIIDNHEILITRNFSNGNYIVNVSKIPKFKGVKFGCELETYFIKDCRKKDFDGKFENKELTQEIYDEKFENVDEIYLSLIRENIIPYLSKSFLKIFRYAYIGTGAFSSYYNKPLLFIDLSNGEVLSKTKEPDLYKYVAFIPDGTLVSGDLENLIQCEIVSPILDNIEDLRILYEGLINTKCNFSDDTAGFHVNISTIDENGYPINLSRGMNTEIIKTWMDYERKNIQSLREKSKYPYEIHPYEYNFGNSFEYEFNNDINYKILSSFIKNKNGTEIKPEDVYSDKGLSMWLLMKKFLEGEKFLSINNKNDSLLEFRVFPSRNDTYTLIHYTKTVIDMISSIMENYCNQRKSIDTVIELQQMYLKYKYDFKRPLPILYEIKTGTKLNSYPLNNMEISNNTFRYSNGIFGLFNKKKIYDDYKDSYYRIVQYKIENVYKYYLYYRGYDEKLTLVKEINESDTI
jgi:hypothetical protein